MNDLCNKFEQTEQNWEQLTKQNEEKKINGMSYKRQGAVDRHDRSYPEGRLHIVRQKS